mmetsp:Transcript_16971/g.38764  ORF Transcript_16971/g.38764 Transcript_16971/m.38764 type:complete len:85 (+) Transcript_16971:125-379(+)
MERFQQSKSSRFPFLRRHSFGDDNDDDVDAVPLAVTVPVQAATEPLAFESAPLLVWNSSNFDLPPKIDPPGRWNAGLLDCWNGH